MFAFLSKNQLVKVSKLVLLVLKDRQVCTAKAVTEIVIEPPSYLSSKMTAFYVQYAIIATSIAITLYVHVCVF